MDPAIPGLAVIVVIVYAVQGFRGRPRSNTFAAAAAASWTFLAILNFQDGDWFALVDAGIAGMIVGDLAANLGTCLGTRRAEREIDLRNRNT